MNTPESMKAELAAWNNGAGIDLERDRKSVV